MSRKAIVVFLTALLTIGCSVLLATNLSLAETVDLPKTGQTSCYDAAGKVIKCTGTGEDGDLQAGIPWPTPRLIDNGDGTITDNLTGLMWLKHANCFGATKWQEALDEISELNANPSAYTCGGYNATYDDWALPNVNELESLINAEEPDSAYWLNVMGFVDVQPSLYWSSTTFAKSSEYAWFVFMSNGTVNNGNKSFWAFSDHYLWPVRSASNPTAAVWRTGQTSMYKAGDDGALKRGTTWPTPRFTDNGDGTVTDNLTGLMWLKDADSLGYGTWKAALNNVKDFNANPKIFSSKGYSASYNDWRLPNRKELHSLTDFSRYGSALPQGHPFFDVKSDYYWTSTIVAYDTCHPWIMSMGNGSVETGSWSDFNYVWPVRGGEVSSTPSANPTSLSVSIGKTGTFKVTGGTIPYSVTSSNSAISTAVVSGSIVTVTGVSKGTATIAVVDSNASSANVTVMVQASAMSASPDSLSLYAGGTAGTVTITGGASPYTAVSSISAVVTAVVSGSEVSVTGLSKGTATITVTDSASNSVTIAVTVSNSGGSIGLISPVNKKNISYGSVNGQVSFSFSDIIGAKGYVLKLDLYDILTYYSVPLQVLLTTASPGFSISGIGIATYTITLNQASWDALAFYDITWSVDALSDIKEVTSIVGISNQWTCKLQPSGAVTLLAPTDGTTLSKKTDSAPQFQWDLYQGASMYNLILAHVGGVAFDKVLNYPALPLNIFPLDNTAWQNMDNGTWYWTVLAQDSAGPVISPNFTILTFDVTGADSGIELSVIPSSMVLKAGQTKNATINGGKGPYAASSSNPIVADVAVTGSTVSVTGVSAGSAYLTIVDSGFKTATVALIVEAITPDKFTNSLGQKFVLIQPGTFTMGSHPNEPGRDTDESQHQVTLTQTFFMQTTEVTQEQWEWVMGSNPSYFSECPSCPVEQVSWIDVQAFIAKLNAMGEGTYSLPTEAQWEYAARAGSSTAFINGGITYYSSMYDCNLDGNLDAVGWYCYNSGSETHPVAQKIPNTWGLYDMHGNVYEWCQDVYTYSYPSGSVSDPEGPLSGSARVVRGGSFSYRAAYCRSANRGNNSPTSKSNSTGLRLLIQP